MAFTGACHDQRDVGLTTGRELPTKLDPKDFANVGEYHEALEDYYAETALYNVEAKPKDKSEE